MDQCQDNHQVIDLVAVSWCIYYMYILINDNVFNFRQAILGAGMRLIIMSVNCFSIKYQERAKLMLHSNINKVIKYIFTSITSSN